MKRKLYITRAIKLTCFFLVAVILTFFLQQYVLRRIDNNSLRMQGFFLEEDNSLDVVVIGASDVYAGFASAYAYGKYGYTSYPFATQAAPASVTLAQIKETVKHQNPKMIIIELNAYLYRDNDLPSEASHRFFTDNVPWDEIKRDYIKEYIDDDKRLEYYLPIIKYHGSWTDYPWKLKYLTSSLMMDRRGYSLFRGYKTIANQFTSPVKTFNEQLADDDSTLPLGSVGERYLRETLEYLQENDIHNVVFMRFPHIVYNKSYTRYQRTNEAGRIIESYGYDFVNLERYALEEGFDVTHDFYNWDHLNVYGSVKLTDYISEMLINDYGLTPGELSDEKKAEWQNSADFFDTIYDYCEVMIGRRLKLGKTGNSGTAVSEDEKSIQTLEKFAAKQASGEITE